MEKLLIQEASDISSMDSEPYEMLKNTIKNIYSNAIIAPYLMAGGTDSRKYLKLCKSIYRFAAMVLPKEEYGTIHSTNERISFKNLSNMIRFYIEFLTNYIH